jgi:hypothetical protein
MLSSQPFPLRPTSNSGVARRTTVRRVLFAAVLVGLRGAGVAWARHEPCTAPKLCDIKPIGDASCWNLQPFDEPSLKGYGCGLKAESYLLDANRGFDRNGKDLFIRVVECALKEYLELERYRGYDVRWEPKLSGSGKKLVSVAEVDGSLQFRIFDRAGAAVKELCEKVLAQQARQTNELKRQRGRINELKKQLRGLPPSNELTRTEKRQIIADVTSIVGCTRSRYNVTRVIAPTGYGKSALFRYLKDILEPRSKISKTLQFGEGDNRIWDIRDELRAIPELENEELIHTIELDQLGSKFAIHSTMLDELKSEAGFPMPALGKLRAFDYDEHAAPGIEFLLHEFVSGYAKLDRPILIIDSIDQIHPESAKSLLVRLDDYVKRRKEIDEQAGTPSVLQIFVVGRPEGFSEYYKISEGGGLKELPIELETPSFQTTGDLRVAAESVVRFNLFGGGQNAHDGKIRRAADKAIRFMNNYYFLRECPYNLSEFGELVKVSDKYGVNLSEYYLKELFFGFLLGRNRASHNRPTVQIEDYTRLLEEIAYRYRDKVDKEGYFFVTPGDLVHIDVEVEGKRETRTSSYLVEAVLNRSGVAYLNPVNLYVPRYRFYPSWVHEYLYSRYMKR